MKADDITQFLRIIGAKNITLDESRGWVKASCPLAHWTHVSGADKKPSFGIKIPEDDGESPSYKCFTCGANGKLPKLLSSLVRLSGDRMLEASNYLSQFQVFDTEIADRPRKRYIVKDKFEHVIPGTRGVAKNIPVPQEVLNQYPLLAEKSELTAASEALRWLVYERRISLQSIANFKLRLYTNVFDDIGVIFPIIAKDGETVLDLWVRKIDEKSFFRLTPAMAGSTVDYKAPNLLFGNHLFTPTQPVIIVEGALDALRLYSIHHLNICASFGGLSSEQAESFYAPVVYLGFDNDDAGREFAKKAVRQLEVPSISILDWGVVGIKDAGELNDLAQFKQVFEARTKIIRDGKKRERRLPKEARPKRVLVGDDGTFL